MIYLVSNGRIDNFDGPDVLGGGVALSAVCSLPDTVVAQSIAAVSGCLMQRIQKVFRPVVGLATSMLASKHAEW